MENQRFARARNWAAGAFVGLWAAFVRALAVFEALQAPFLDKYPRAARRLLTGELAPERWLDFSPFYLGLSALLEALGLPVRETLLTLQAAAGVAAALVAFRLARRWAGLTAGVAAGLLVGSSRMGVVGGAILEPEIWLGLGLLAGVWLLARETTRWDLPASAAGLCFAAAALVRPNALLVPVLLLGLALAIRRETLRPAVVATGVAAAGFALGLALWLGPRMPPSDWRALMSPGQVFHQGNARDASGFGLHYPVSVQWASARFGGDRPDFEHQAYRDVARAETQTCLSPARAESFWRGKAWEAMGEQPGMALRRAGARLLGTLHRRQVWDVAGAARLEARLAWPAPVEMPVLLPLALVGFVLPGRRRRLLLLLPLLLLPFLTSTVFFASGRHRVLLDLALAVAAGVGVAGLVDRFRRRSTWSPRRAGVVLTALVVGTLVPFLPLAAVEGNRQWIALDEAGRDNLHGALSAWGRGETTQAETLAAGAVVLDVVLEDELPEALRGRPGFRRRGAELARDLVLTGEGAVTARAAAALVQLAGCSELETAWRTRRERGPEIQAAFRPGIALLVAGCELRTGETPGEGLDVLEKLGRRQELTVRGHGMVAAAHMLRGLSVQEALTVFPGSYDALSTKLALAEALRIAGLSDVAGRLELEATTHLDRSRQRCKGLTERSRSDTIESGS